MSKRLRSESSRDDWLPVFEARGLIGQVVHIVIKDGKKRLMRDAGYTIMYLKVFSDSIQISRKEIDDKKGAWLHTDITGLVSAEIRTMGDLKILEILTRKSNGSKKSV